MSTRAIIEFPDTLYVTGRRGRSFYALEAAPAADLGYEGDGAVDVLTGAIYVRAVGAWSETGENFFAGAIAAAGVATTKAGEAGDDRVLAQAAAATATTKAGEASDDRVLAQAAAATATTKAAEAVTTVSTVDPLEGTIFEAAGIGPGIYVLTDFHPGPRTYKRAVARRRLGYGAITFNVTVDGVVVFGPVTLGDTTLVQSGLTIAVPSGSEVALVVTAASATATLLAFQLDGV